MDKRQVNNIGKKRWIDAQSAELDYWENIAKQSSQIVLRNFLEKIDCVEKIQKVVPGVYDTVTNHNIRIAEIGIGPLGIGIAQFLCPYAQEIVGIEPLPRITPELSSIVSSSYQKMMDIPLTYIQRPGEDTGLPQEYYDLVICFNVLDHTPHWPDIIKEINRILKKDGYFILDQNTVSILKKAKWYFWERHIRRNDPNIVAHPSYFTAYQLENLFSKYKFSLIYIDKNGNETFQRIFGKYRRMLAIGQKNLEA